MAYINLGRLTATDLSNILTTKGDILTYTTLPARLAVGTDNQVLTADSAEASGIKWAAASAGAPTDASYVTIGLNGTLTAERVLTQGAGITLTDGGANGNATLTTRIETDDIWDAKGDLLIGTGADTAARLAIGANGTVTVADSTQTTGIKWAALGYTLQAVFPSTSPTDATTYYIGARHTSSTVESVTGRIYMPIASTLKKVYVHVNNAGTLGTAETSTISFRLNATADTTIVSTLTTNSTNALFSNTAMSVAIAANDFFQIKWVTPTWATNPTSVSMSIVCYFEV